MRPRSRQVAALAGLILLGSFGFVLPAAPRAQKEARSDRVPQFESDVLPIFRARCLRCHGEKVRRADLDLRTASGVLKGGETGPAVVPGSPDKSLLYEKIHGGEMPPSKKDRLNKDEVAIIRGWIAGGAPAAKEKDPPLTQHDVLPILLRHCTVCHGARRQEGGLDLRTRASMLRGGKSGPAIVAGKPDKSLLIEKVSSKAMPPPKRLVEVSVKPIEPAEIETLKRWISQGAPEVAVAEDVATTTPDPLVSDRDRDFWAFRSPRPVAIPDVRSSFRNPIDAFIVQKLAKKGLTLSPEAGRASLLRRVYFDLLGLPPTPEEVHAFLDDRSPDAYESLIDRLLADPRYGERWGRRWLDVAGYADSEGKREQDLYRPHAWRYRDYVVRAFADDKPYDRFLLEQLAGDELADYENASRITPELYDNLVATGFLRMAPDATWANITGFVPDRIDVVSDEIDVLGSAVMGLTLKCARCHSHKFDPLPQRDYYRMVAIFKGAFDEYDWLKPDVRPGIGPVSEDTQPGRHLPFVTTEERDAWKSHNAPIEKEIASLLMRKAPAKDVNAIRARLLPEPRIHALWDRGDPSPTYVYRRGDPLTPGRLVGPGVPSVLTDGKTPFTVQPPWKGAKKTGRRLAFAKWLTRPDHPLTARVMVNRIWKHHFGQGIVRTLGNFGKAGTRPSHPELLDWLALEFVRQGWSVKQMHRLMLTSAVYRQGSEVTDEHEKLDPDNELFSRMPMVRLDAESLYDAMLLVAGQLDGARFGPGDAVTVRRDGLATPVGTSRGWRRLIYVRQMRKQLPTHLENFDFPQMSPNCLERRDSTVAPQALHLLNNGMVRTLADSFARRVLLEAGRDAGKQVERVYLIALSRPASAQEKRDGVEALATLAERWGGQDREVKALTSFCHVMLNSAAFLYVD